MENKKNIIILISIIAGFALVVLIYLFAYNQGFKKGASRMSQNAIKNLENIKKVEIEPGKIFANSELLGIDEKKETIFIRNASGHINNITLGGDVIYFNGDKKMSLEEFKGEVAKMFNSFEEGQSDKTTIPKIIKLKIEFNEEMSQETEKISANQVKSIAIVSN